MVKILVDTTTNNMDREQYIIKLYKQIYPEAKVSRETIINGTTIQKLCSYDGPPYQRIKKWCESTLKKKEEMEIKPINETKRETKFSGNKEEYVGGATRDSSSGKGRYDLISPLFLKRLAGVLEVGAKNHGSNNWMGGIPFSRLIDSSLRHISQYNSGMRDEDHIVQAVCNLMFLVHFEEENRKELMDLLPPKI